MPSSPHELFSFLFYILWFQKEVILTKKKKLKNDRKALCKNWSIRKEKAIAEAGMGDRSQRRKPTVLSFRQVTSKFCCNSAAIWSCLGIFENYWCLHGTFRLSNLINMGTIWTLRYQFLGGSNMQQVKGNEVTKTDSLVKDVTFMLGRSLDSKLVLTST